MLYRIHLTMSGMYTNSQLYNCLGTDCTGSCKSNYHTFMTATAPTYLSVWGWYWTDKIIKYRNIYLIKGKRKIVNYIWLVHSFIFLFLQFIHSFPHPWSRVVVIFIIVCHTTNFKTIDSWKSCHAVNVRMLIMLHELVSVYICKTQIDFQPLINVKSSNSCLISTSQTSVPQIYMHICMSFFQILKSASNFQIYGRFALSQIQRCHIDLRILKGRRFENIVKSICDLR